MPQLVPCPICGEGRFRLFLNDTRGQLVKCAACRFVYVNPQPTDEELEHLYGEYYQQEDRGLADSLCFRRPVFEHGVEMLDRLASGGRLLDIGCGTGDFLVHAQQAGWEVAGVELSERAAAHARGRGLDVRTGALADQEFHPDSFDVATVWDVLEHLPQPRLELMAVRCLLKPGGMLVVRVPNVRAQIMRMYATKVLGKPGGAHLQADLHLNHFTPRTLTLLLERSGFAVFRQEPGVSDDRVFSDGFSLWEKKYYCKLARMIARLTSIQIGLTVVQYARRL